MTSPDQREKATCAMHRSCGPQGMPPKLCFQFSQLLILSNEILGSWEFSMVDRYFPWHIKLTI